MTYQASSNKFFINDLKQRLWAIILMFLVFFIMEPMSLIMTIDNFELYNDVSFIPTCISDYLSYGFAGDGRYAMIAGGIMAFLCFGYLYSKSAVDLFHSLPVKREKIFLFKLIIGAGFGIAILIICSACSLLVVGIKGYISARVIKALLLTSLKGIVLYLTTFTAATLAIMLTGTITIGILGAVTIAAIPSLATWIFDGYMNLCFSTYYPYIDKISVAQVLFNPMKLIDVTVKNKNFPVLFSIVLVEIIIGLLICLILFVKRPSESVAKSISFNTAKTIIRIVLVFFMALTGGLYVSYIASSLAAYWYWAAFVGTGLLTHAVLELIFEQELKGIIRHPIQFVICMSAAALVSLCLQFDWLGYDSYIPGEDMLESVSVRLMNIENDLGMYELNEFGDWEYSQRDDFYDKVECDKETAIKLANVSIAKLDKSESAIKRHVRDMSEGYVDMSTSCSYVICYHLASGRDIFRGYQADVSEIENDIRAVYENSTYKDFIYGISPEVKASIKNTISCMDAMQNVVFSSGKIDGDKFLDAYCLDLCDRKFDDLKDFAIFTLSGYDMVSGMDFLSMRTVYETDKRTIAYLESLGINIDDYRELVKPEMVESITVTDYSSSDNQLRYSEPKTVEYTAKKDMDKIIELTKQAVPQGVAYINSILHPLSDNVGLSINYMTRDGMKREDYFEVLKGTEVF